MLRTRVSRLSLALLLPALVLLVPDVGHAQAPDKSVLGHWAGAMVFTMGEKTVVYPVELTFRKDGKVDLLRRSGGGDKETQTYTFDAKARRITFFHGDKVDARLDFKTLHEQAMVGSMTPASGPEDGLRIEVFLGRVGEN